MTRCVMSAMEYSVMESTHPSTVDLLAVCSTIVSTVGPLYMHYPVNITTAPSPRTLVIDREQCLFVDTITDYGPTPGNLDLALTINKNV